MKCKVQHLADEFQLHESSQALESATLIVSDTRARQFLAEFSMLYYTPQNTDKKRLIYLFIEVLQGIFIQPHKAPHLYKYIQISIFMWLSGKCLR